MTLQWLKERLKEEGVTLYSEQVNGIKKKWGNCVFCHIPIKSSSKEKIISSAKEKNVFILHSDGTINTEVKPKEKFFFGLYVWYDPEPNLILAY